MKKKLIVILGPTAVGKSDLSIELALRFNAPVVSADSRQIFREMSIGTAVPSAEQLQQVRHYFIHSKSVTEPYTAGMYERDALALLEELFRHHDYVLLTGGSGLYIDALCDGMDAVPAADELLRRSLEERFGREGLEGLLAELKIVDPDFYEQVDRNNPKRVLRALEVCLGTGQPYSSLRSGERKERDFSVVKIGLNLPREILYARINERVDRMMAAGLAEEVRLLIPYRNCNALQTVGYKELFEYMDGSIDLETAVELIKRNSRRYAKRQLTWFSRCDRTRWFSPADTAQIAAAIENDD